MTDVQETRTTVTLTVNGRTVEAQPGEMLIAAAERVGTYIPRFCYHPRMKPVGVCRMCLVEVDGPRGATLQPACYIPVNEGMVVNTESEKVKKAQDGVLEFLLANHPLDCPVCDKGGECPLQDQTLAHGSGETRFIEEKRHFAKPISIGELVLLDRERCIQCSRCTRFSAEVAGDAQIDFAGRGDSIEVAPFPTEPFDSVFSGNTVQICPVGALTAKPYRFTARPWDLEQVESTCTTCSVGCRVAVQSSGNRLTRALGVDSDAVNHGWLCDKGRFVLDAVHGDEESSDVLSPRTRLSTPLVRKDGVLAPATWGEALSAAARLISAAASKDPQSVGAIGGAALTNEGAFAWQRFMTGVVGTNALDAQYGDGIDPALLAAIPRATITDMAEACTVLVLAGDLREELPIVYLRLRESVQAGKTSVITLSSAPGATASLARTALTVRPGEAHVIAEALATTDKALSALPGGARRSLTSAADLAEARKLMGETGDGVVVIVGRSNVAEGSDVVENAVRTLAQRFPHAKFLPALRRGNVIGALDMGLAPNVQPGRGVASERGRDTIAQLTALADGTQSVVVSLGGDVLANVADGALATRALKKGSLVAVTGHGGPSLAYADVVLPATVTHERFGTVTNIEGRVTALAPKIVPPGSAWPDVAIAAELAEELGQHLGLSSPEDTAAAITATTGYPTAAALADSSVEGVVVGQTHAAAARRPMDPMAFPGVRSAELVGLAPRAGAVVSIEPNTHGAVATPALADVATNELKKLAAPADGELLLVTTSHLYDQSAAVQGTEHLANLVAPAVAYVHASDAAALGGSTHVLSNAHGKVSLPIVVRDDVPRGCVVVSADAAKPLLDATALVTSVKVGK